MRDVQKKFNVRYFLNLVLVDEEDRRYYKQHEIMLWRKGEKFRARSVGSGTTSAQSKQQQQSAAMKQYHGTRQMPQTATRKARNDLVDAFQPGIVAAKDGEGDDSEVKSESPVTTKTFPSGAASAGAGGDEGQPASPADKSNATNDMSEENEKITISKETTKISDDEIERNNLQSVAANTSPPPIVKNTAQNLFGDDDDDD